MFRTRTVPSRRGLNLMQLEDRAVPAGNITATLGDAWFGPALVIEGDDLANSVVLTGKGDGVVEIRGVNTTINGGSKPVTFTGVANIWVDVRGGDDTVRSSGLSFRDSGVYIEINAGAGDDTVRLSDTTAIDSGLGIAVYADQWDEPNGNDRIDITGTTVQGPSLFFDINGDGSATETGEDTISITNTKYSHSSAEPGDFGGVFFQASTGWEEGADGGDDSLTVDNFSAVASADNLEALFVILTDAGDDQVRFSNIDIHFEAPEFSYIEMFLSDEDEYYGGFGSVDTLELRNVNITETGGGYGTLLGFESEVTDVKNVNVQADGWISMGFRTERADISNVAFTSNREAWLGVDSQGLFGEPTTFDSTDFRLTNIHLASNNEAWPSMIYFSGGDAPNRVTLTNCSADRLFSAPFFGIPNAGDDELTLTNCHFGFVFVEMGDGNDTVTLQNNTFGDVEVDLGDGDDTATVQNNTASTSIAIDGGDGTDTLIAWLNIAPFVDFDNFEL